MRPLLLALGSLLASHVALAGDVWDDPFPGVRHLNRTGPSNLNIHAVVVDLCAPGVSVRTTAYAERQQRTSTFATSVGAQLAINADFSCRPIDTGPNSPFAPCVGHVPYVTYGVAMHDGVQWPGTLGLDALLAFGADRVQLFDNADMQPFDATWMKEGTGGHFSSVIDGAANGYDCPIDPRTAMGLSKDRTKLILVVADGRGIWRGITCREAADLMVELGADRGSGLDSGGSSTMWFSGQGVLNHPSDGSERVVGNHLAIFATGTGSPAHCVQPPTMVNAAATLPPVTPFSALGRFTGLTPVRMFDTRVAASNLTGLTKDATGRVAASSPFTFTVAGSFGVPANATAVAMNLTAADEAAGGFARVWPQGATAPTASVLNYVPGGAITNSTLVGLGTPSGLSVDVSQPTQLIGDLQGYFAPTGAGFVPQAAHRLLDTRTDPAGLLHPHVSRVIVPAGTSASSAVALNVTALGSTADGFVTVYPCGEPVPTTSSVNFVAGQTIVSSVIARMGPTGICADALVDVHLIVDTVGTFEAVGGLSFQAVAPVRLVDTRNANSPWVGRTMRQSPLELNLAGLSGLPADAHAVALNVAVTGAVDDGFVTIYPCADGVPPTSNVNYRAGQTIANSVLVGLGNGKLCLNSTGRTHVIIDLTGIFVGTPAEVADAGLVEDAGVLAPVTDGGVSASDGGSGASMSPDPTTPAGCGCSGGPLELVGAVGLLAQVLRRRGGR
jgi:hypothetical protein